MIDPREFVDVVHAAGFALRIDAHFAHHRVGDQRDVAGGHRRRNEHGGALEVRLDGTAAATVGGIKAGHTLVHALAQHALGERVAGMQLGRQAGRVLALREHRAVRRDDRNLEWVARLLGEQLVGARGRRWLQHTGRRARRVLQVILTAVHADQQLRLVVVRRHRVVRHRPIGTEPVARLGLEVVRPHAQRDAAPVVGASAQHARTPPAELAAWRGGERLARHPPAAVDRGVVEAEGLVRIAAAAQGRVFRRLEHRCFGDRVVVTPCLEQQHLEPLHRQLIGGHATTGTGTDHDDIVLRRNFGTGGHENTPLRAGCGGAPMHLLRSYRRDGRRAARAVRARGASTGRKIAL